MNQSEEHKADFRDILKRIVAYFEKSTYENFAKLQELQSEILNAYMKDEITYGEKSALYDLTVHCMNHMERDLKKR